MFPLEQSYGLWFDYVKEIFHNSWNNESLGE